MADSKRMVSLGALVMSLRPKSSWGTAILTGFPRSKMSEWMLLLQLPTLAHQPDLAVREEPRAGLCLRQEGRAGGIVPPHLYSHPWNVCPRC